MNSTKGQTEERGTTPEADEGQKAARRKWPLKTWIELLPVIIALTVFFSISTIKKVTDVPLVTPLRTVVGDVPAWTIGLMAMIVIVGICGMGWLIYIFSRAPVNPDGSNEAES